MATGWRTFGKWAGIGAAGIVAVGALAAWRGGGCGPHGLGRDPAAVAAFVTDRVDDALDDLEATPAQREQVHAAKQRLLDRGAGERAAGRAAREAMLAEWRAASPDRARLHALVDERARAMTALAHAAVDEVLEVHASLAPEQREKLVRKVERRMGRE
jgi:Spy/CpxP family protein refolding chaperone